MDSLFYDGDTTVVALHFLQFLRGAGPQAPPQDKTDKKVEVSRLLPGDDKAAIPALKEAYAKAKDSLTRLGIAADLVRLGEQDKVYWEYLVASADAAMNNAMPFPLVYDEKGHMVRDKISDEFLAWVRAE